MSTVFQIAGALLACCGNTPRVNWFFVDAVEWLDAGNGNFGTTEFFKTKHRTNSSLHSMIILVTTPRPEWRGLRPLFPASTPSLAERAPQADPE
jgi:hypothetical protein